MSSSSGPSPQNTTGESQAAGTAYPEQRHAGKVGYGPNFRTDPTLGDKIVGLKEEIHGKLAHRPDLVQEGHDRRTGELRKRNLMGSEDKDPFAIPGDDKSSHSTTSPKSSSSSDRPPSHGLKGSSSSDPETMAQRAHTSGPGAREEASLVDPQGSQGGGYGPSHGVVPPELGGDMESTEK